MRLRKLGGREFEGVGRSSSRCIAPGDEHCGSRAQVLWSSDGTVPFIEDDQCSQGVVVTNVVES